MKTPFLQSEIKSLTHGVLGVCALGSFQDLVDLRMEDEKIKQVSEDARYTV